MNKKKILMNEEGSGLVLALMVLMVLSVLGASLGMVTIGSHLQGNINLKVNSAYYVAEAGANLAYGELKNEIPNIYSDSTSMSSVTFFSNISKFIYTDDRLHNTNYQSFSQQNGENPRAEIRIIEINESDTTKEYVIESKGIVGNNSKTVNKRVLVRWFDKYADKADTLPFPLPPLGSAITFSEKINFTGNETKIIGDITHTGSGTMNIEKSWLSEHKGNFSSDSTIDLAKYTVDLSSYKPAVLKPEVNSNHFAIPSIDDYPGIPNINNQMFESDETSITLHENTYIPKIEREYGRKLNIYIPDREIYLVVDNLTLKGKNELNILGNGKLNLVVRSNLSTNYDLKINQGDSSEKINLIYNGANALNFVGEFKINGNIFSQKSSINVGFKNNINGSVLTGNGNINVGNESNVIGSVETRKGNVTIGDTANVNGRVMSGNGNIKTEKSAKISGDVVTKSGNLNIGFRSELLGSVISGNGNIDIGGELTIPGDVVTKKGYVKVAANSNINGVMVSGEGNIELGYNNNAKKGISTSNGDVKVNYGSNIVGNVLTSNGKIEFIGASKVSGNIHTGLGNISFGWDSSGSGIPTVNGNIITNNGEISIGGNSLINGVVMNDGGNVSIGQDITLNGIVFTNGYDLTIGWNTTVNGALIVGEGSTKFNGESKVTGTIVSKNITFGFKERVEYSEDYLEDFIFSPGPENNPGEGINIEELISTKPATEN